jgi:hypothetical protein
MAVKYDLLLRNNADRLIALKLSLSDGTISLAAPYSDSRSLQGQSNHPPPLLASARLNPVIGRYSFKDSRAFA